MICPECERPLKIGGHPLRGRRVHCNNCKAKLVVVGVKPLELEVAVPANRNAKSKKEAGVVETVCPQCDHMIKLSHRSRQGERVVCAVCHTQLAVVSTDPLELDVASMIKSWHNRW
jgi:uncharacterized paraquat-inducible protein A